MTQSVGQMTAQHTGETLATVYRGFISASLPTEGHLSRLVSNTLIQGAASADWWSRQNADTVWRFANAVRQGVAAGETNEQIVRRITGGRASPGVMDISARHARGLVHTSIQSVANAARVDTFERNRDVVTAIVWLATLDGNTCPEICGPRDLKRYSLKDHDPIGHSLPWDGGPGAIHFSCRCNSTAETKTFRELGIDADEPPLGQRASVDGPVSANMDFGSWLARRSPAEIEEQLGPGRAELFTSGKINLASLLDMQGNPLTLEQLRARFAR